MIVADTSGLIALFNRREPSHAAVTAAVEASDEPLVVSPFVLAELDYLIATRLGHRSEVEALRELAGGAYVLPEMSAADISVAVDVLERYSDLDIGLADASLVVLCDRFDTLQLLTLDRRHFQAVRSLDGEPFELIPG